MSSGAIHHGIPQQTQAPPPLPSNVIDLRNPVNAALFSGLNVPQFNWGSSQYPQNVAQYGTYLVVNPTAAQIRTLPPGSPYPTAAPSFNLNQTQAYTQASPLARQIFNSLASPSQHGLVTNPLAFQNAFQALGSGPGVAPGLAGQPQTPTSPAIGSQIAGVNQAIANMRARAQAIQNLDVTDPQFRQKALRLIAGPQAQRAPGVGGLG